MTQKTKNNAINFNTKEMKKLSQMVVESFVKDAIVNLAIDPKGKSEEEINLEIFNHFKPIISSKDTKFNVIVDHRISILKECRRFRKLNKKEFACTFYAIWFEHWINNIIVVYGARKNLSTDELFQVIRESSIRAKFSWLLSLLQVPNISIKHRNTVFRLFDLRNGYVHYKWKGYDIDNDDKQEVELDNVLSVIEKTVKYFIQFENKYIYLSSKKKIKRIIKKKPNKRLNPTAK